VKEYQYVFFQCFDTVLWAAGRLRKKNLSSEKFVTRNCQRFLFSRPLEDLA